MGLTDVSNSVLAIVSAYARCRDVLNKVRSRTGGKLSKNRSADVEEEARLDWSLTRAAIEIDNEYSRGLQALGPPFARGDGPAQLLLQTTLAKLNTGLVDIISAFLVSKEPKKLRLDFRSLTALADTSWTEAKDGLFQLGRRISPSALSLQPGAGCSRCGAPGHHECSGKTKKGHALRSTKSVDASAPAHGRPARSATPKEYVAGVRHANQTHWAVVRTWPQKKRTGSSLSTSSSGSNVSSNSVGNIYSSNATTLRGTPPTSHLSSSLPPTNHNRRPHPRNNPPGGKTHAHKKKQSDTLVHPSQTQQSLPLKEAHLARIPEIRKPASMQQLPSSPGHQQQQQNRPGRECDRSAQRYIPQRRRQEQPTNSIHSFNSDSTKLGEIPTHKWATPFDFDEMERLNAEAGARIWGPDSHAAAPLAGPAKSGKRRGGGLFARIFRIGPLEPIVEA